MQMIINISDPEGRMSLNHKPPGPNDPFVLIESEALLFRTRSHWSSDQSSVVLIKQQDVKLSRGSLSQWITAKGAEWLSPGVGGKKSFPGPVRRMHLVRWWPGCPPTGQGLLFVPSEQRYWNNKSSEMEMFGILQGSGEIGHGQEKDIWNTREHKVLNPVDWASRIQLCCHSNLSFQTRKSSEAQMWSGGHAEI